MTFVALEIALLMLGTVVLGMVAGWLLCGLRRGTQMGQLIQENDQAVLRADRRLRRAETDSAAHQARMSELEVEFDEVAKASSEHQLDLASRDRDLVRLRSLNNDLSGAVTKHKSIETKLKARIGELEAELKSPPRVMSLSESSDTVAPDSPQAEMVAEYEAALAETFDDLEQARSALAAAQAQIATYEEGRNEQLAGRALADAEPRSAVTDAEFEALGQETARVKEVLSSHDRTITDQLARIRDLRGELDRANLALAQRTDDRARAATLTQRVAALEAELRTLREAADEASELQVAVGSRDQRIVSLTNQLDSMRRVRSELERSNRMIAERDTRIATLTKVYADNRSLEAKLTSLEEEQRTFERSQAALRSELEGQRLGRNSDREQFDESLAESRKRIAELERATEDYESRQHQLSADHQRLVNELEVARELTTTVVAERDARIEIDQFEAEQRRANQLSTRLERTETERERLRKQLDLLRAEVRSLRTDFEEQKALAETAEKTTRIDLAERERLRSRRAELEAELSRRDSTIDRLRGELDTAKSERSRQKVSETVQPQTSRTHQTSRTNLTNRTTTPSGGTSRVEAAVANLQRSTTTATSPGRYERPEATPTPASVADRMAEIAKRTAGDGSVATDALTKIYGIGPKYEGVLNSMGITSFAQLARLEDDDIDAVGEALENDPSRITRDDWVGQARRLHQETHGIELAG